MDMNTKQKTVQGRSSNFQPRTSSLSENPPGKIELVFPEKPPAKIGKKFDIGIF